MRRVKSAPPIEAESSKQNGAKSSNIAITRVLLAAIGLLILIAGIFVMGLARTKLDPTAHGQHKFQDQLSGISANGPERFSPMEGAQLTDEQRAREVPTSIDVESAACRSCDARHRNLLRLKQTKVP